MPEPQLGRRELVQALTDVGSMLTSPRPLRQRIESLCEAIVIALGCNRASVFLWHDNHYRATYNYGNPAWIAEIFKTYTIGRERTFVSELEASELPYLLLNDTQAHESTAKVAKKAGIGSAVITRITQPDGQPIGMLTAESERVNSFTPEMAELVVGAAGLALGALMHNAEVQRRVQMAEAMFEVEELERRRLSREIHDDPLQRLLALRVGLESCRDQANEPLIQAQLTQLVSECRDASASLRQVMNRTNPSASDQADLETTLRIVLAKRARDAGLRFSLDDQTRVAAPSQVAATFARIAEQASSNVIQHASAKWLMLAISNRDNGTELSITDDGVGFDPAAPTVGHLGLVSMRERTEMLNGTFALHSEIGSGTNLTVWLPHSAPTGH